MIMREHHPLLPGRIAIGKRGGKHDLVEGASREQDFVDVVLIEIGNRKTALIGLRHQPLGGEAIQRLAQRARAGLIARAQGIDAQPVARRQHAADDVLLQRG